MDLQRVKVHVQHHFSHNRFCGLKIRGDFLEGITSLFPPTLSIPDGHDGIAMLFSCIDGQAILKYLSLLHNSYGSL